MKYWLEILFSSTAKEMNSEVQCLRNIRVINLLSYLIFYNIIITFGKLITGH